ncbi:inner membrane protein import complex subunit Tim54-domain-containing protein [Powellomyces hirtus]|nr:inner membrane protein import complex subunit Tim54-domain-containing protein [Powellomyces hirtus]
MTVLTSIRARLPSRNWSIFWGLTSSLTGAACYDKYQLGQVRAELDQATAALRNEICKPTDTPRRIRVYVAPTHWGRYWFKEYVKPVFDAAALDYEILEPKVAGQVRDSVRELLWTGKDEHRARAASGHKYNPFTPPAPILERDKFDAGEGLVAVGPNAWREVLRGVSEGCLAERPPAPPPTPESTPSTTDAATDDPAAAKTAKADPLPPPPPLDLSDHNIPTFPLPPLGFITARQQAGWTGFPSRIYHWFTERYTAREVGYEALAIALGRVRPFNISTDPARGAKDIYVHDDWEQRHKDVVQDVQVPGSVADRLYMYQ